jgi:hypothetical protein
MSIDMLGILADFVFLIVGFMVGGAVGYGGLRKLVQAGAPITIQDRVYTAKLANESEKIYHFVLLVSLYLKTRLEPVPEFEAGKIDLAKKKSDLIQSLNINIDRIMEDDPHGFNLFMQYLETTTMDRSKVRDLVSAAHTIK